MTSLDPRAPLVLDVRELGRRAGAMKALTRVAAAPAEFGLPLIGVPEGSEIDLNLRLESVHDGVLVSGTAQVTVTGECSRCLEPLSWNKDVSLQELFMYPVTDAKGRVIDSNDDDDEQYRVENDLIDLEPVLRDAVILGLPLTPLCAVDCPGLCSICGARLADDPTHQHDEVDPRWAALDALKNALPKED